MLEKGEGQRHWNKMLHTLLARADRWEGGKQADPGNTKNQRGAKRRLEIEALSAHPLVRCLLPVTSAR